LRVAYRRSLKFEPADMATADHGHDQLLVRRRRAGFGTEGTIEVPRGVILGLGTRAPEGLVVVVDADGNRREELFEPVNQYGNMVDSFAESVLNKQPTPLPAEDGLNNVKVLEALTRSAAKNLAEHV
jgi:D-xylose 1-dehydrogenase (NADP+, D-xylono-1,5-lactone-forming)